MSLHIKHLIGLQNVPKEDIEIILKSAKKFKDYFQKSKKKLTDLSGKTIANLFFEDSTRTRTSFELAEKRLSADVLNFSSSSSSLSKGESLKDTVKNIEAMNIDMIVVRHTSAGIPFYLTKYSQSIIINAGDGAHEHPTQGLLDIYTIQEKLGQIKGLNICIVGDIAHSRVALSNLFGLKTLGANVSF
ncbi:MAG: aspartate carbamoyltransferase, partial [Bacteroidetes bacterium]|nr:aspartate carbamoyltransferase [Bacteroidota bacterium]